MEKSEVVENSPWRGEDAYEILFPKGVDTVFDPDGGIGLGQHGRRHPDQPNTAVRGRGRKTNHVSHRAAAHGHHVGMPA